jgi:hypothetical protein
MTTLQNILVLAGRDSRKIHQNEIYEGTKRLKNATIGWMRGRTVVKTEDRLAAILSSLSGVSREEVRVALNDVVSVELPYHVDREEPIEEYIILRRAENAQKPSFVVEYGNRY